MRDMNSIFGGLDAYVSPADDFTSLGITNLTGHPALVAPCGFEQNNMPRSITLTGHIYGESQLIALGRAWQEHSEYHLQRPPLKPLDETGK
jgi:Asp-tRNA(Asn)/Glu-tRNA(Gln) amidotransferase A subunit family amidase